LLLQTESEDFIIELLLWKHYRTRKNLLFFNIIDAAGANVDNDI